MGTVALDAAIAAKEQADRDLVEAIDQAMTADHVANRLAMERALRAMRYIESNGLTPEGRKRLRTGIEAARAVLGLEDD
ncbi:MAG: hypothetical protein KDD77_05530 [Caldilineaceae bacterium]|nr:hypothetical protein [Caldilineaceae bacterium]